MTRLEKDRLVQEAVDASGSSDFGSPTWEEGFDVLLASLLSEARLHEIGVEVACADLATCLKNRLDLVAWRTAHPTLAQERIEQPIFIVGQPRTGTTILFDLLALDPDLRAPMTWEVDRPVPPPLAETFRTDARIAEVQSTLDMAEAVMPGFLSFHPMGAELAQECVRMTGSEFRSMAFPVQYRIPSYSRWLLDEADMAPAYAWHRRYLQHLQSNVTGQWLLKSPAHLWHLTALAAEYPDAIIVQTHRDPLKVIASVSALAAHLRTMASSSGTIAEAAEQYSEEILDGLARGMADRDAGVFPASQVVDVQFREFVTDPFGTIKALYAQLGRELAPSTEAAMRAFLQAHPGDGGIGRYSWDSTGLEADAFRERVAAYQERYGVPSEPVT